ncbi:hypothetical protein [Algoriphagus sp.]|uniref:hypothetical protein n=1 Tax=Algoriphagus sp. TaxID=1872435 RepID=UPI00329891B3
MKKSIHSLLFIFLIISLGACSSSEDAQPTVPDGVPGTPGNPATELPIGAVKILKSGNFTAQSGTSTKGMIDLISDEGGRFFVKLGTDFTTKFSTGTVTVYLSTSKDLALSEQSSFQLVAVVNKSGEHFFKLPNSPAAKFTHGIIWCGAAAIPFGFAEIK